MIKVLSSAKLDQYDKILTESSIDAEKDGLTQEEKVEIKSYAIKTNLRLQRHVRN